MIYLDDFIIKESPRRNPRYNGEVNRTKYFKYDCPNCEAELGYISKSRYNKKKSCNKCSNIKRENIQINHWSKLGLEPWNKGSTSEEQRLKNKLRINLRSRLNKAIAGNYKAGSAVSDLGCSIEELKRHLESQFQEGMSWDNYGRKGWHIDHIVPLANFDLTLEADIKIACHHTNLQPLWAKDNISKGAG